MKKNSLLLISITCILLSFNSLSAGYTNEIFKIHNEFVHRSNQDLNQFMAWKMQDNQRKLQERAIMDRIEDAELSPAQIKAKYRRRAAEEKAQEEDFNRFLHGQINQMRQMRGAPPIEYYENNTPRFAD